MDDDDIYVVEQILNRRVRDDGQIEYFLKWFGYSEDDATWEPEENVFCKDLIRLYEKNVYLMEKIEDECRSILSQLLNDVELVLSTFDDDNLVGVGSCTLSMNGGISSPEATSKSKLTSTRRRKRTKTTPLTRRKKLRSAPSAAIVDENANDIPSHEQIEMANATIDYLSLEPEQIVSITRSRLPTEQPEFLLKCTRHPKKLFFISNDKAKELVPDLLIQFYERHISWLLNSPSSSVKARKRQL